MDMRDSFDREDKNAATKMQRVMPFMLWGDGCVDSWHGTAAEQILTELAEHAGLGRCRNFMTCQ